MSAQLYLISPPQIHVDEFRHELAAALSAANTGMIGAFQMRLKDADDAHITTAIKTLMPVCRAHQVIFIINDRPDLCAEFGCDGVHVGQEDLLSGFGTRTSADAISYIRKVVGDKAAIGVTCHASMHLAMEAAEAGADYVAFGAFYPTTSKPKEKLEKWGTPTMDILTAWSQYTNVPCVAIGGITPHNALPLVRAGADMIAVINAVWSHPQGASEGVRAFDFINN